MSQGNIVDKKKYDGFSFMELLIILAIIALLFTKGSTVFAKTINTCKSIVCDLNCKTYTFDYVEYLDDKNIDHNDIVLKKFLAENGRHPCPNDGDIVFENEKLKCEYHRGENLDEVEEVPYL